MDKKTCSAFIALGVLGIALASPLPTAKADPDIPSSNTAISMKSQTVKDNNQNNLLDSGDVTVTVIEITNGQDNSSVTVDAPAINTDEAYVNNVSCSTNGTITQEPATNSFVIDNLTPDQVIDCTYEIPLTTVSEHITTNFRFKAEPKVGEPVSVTVSYPINSPLPLPTTTSTPVVDTDPPTPPATTTPSPVVDTDPPTPPATTTTPSSVVDTDPPTPPATTPTPAPTPTPSPVVDTDPPTPPATTPSATQSASSTPNPVQTPAPSPSASNSSPTPSGTNSASASPSSGPSTSVEFPTPTATSSSTGIPVPTPTSSTPVTSTPVTTTTSTNSATSTSTSSSSASTPVTSQGAANPYDPSGTTRAVTVTTVPVPTKVPGTTSTSSYSTPNLAQTGGEDIAVLSSGLLASLAGALILLSRKK